MGLHFCGSSETDTQLSRRLIALIGWQETSDDSTPSLVSTNEGGGEPPGWACIHLGTKTAKTHNSE